MTKPKMALVAPGSSTRPVGPSIRPLDTWKYLSDPQAAASLSRDHAQQLLDAYRSLAALIAVAERSLLERLAAPTEPQEQDEVLTIEEAAKRLGRKESYVAELVRKRKIPAVNLPSPKDGREGKYTGILKSSLLAWAKAHEDPGVR